MSLLALLATTTTTPGDPDPPPDPPTVPASLLHSTDHAVLDFTDPTVLVALASLPGYSQLREQDDIIYDPGATDPNKRWCFYFSAVVNNNSRIWVTHSPDGIEWSNPVFCFTGEDPSITQTWEPNPVAYRDEQGRLVMFCENNGTSDIDAYVSTDGLTWTRTQAAAIARAAGSTGWDHALVGSPNARHDGTKFIVGYEGIQENPSRIETFSVAWGTSPSSLTKTPNNPVIDPTVSHPSIGNSIVSDGIYLTPAGDRVILTAHSGLSSSGGNGTMWRMTTTNLDPTTWAPGDFTLIGGMADPDHSGDFTLDAYRGRVVTKGNMGNALTMVSVPLVAGAPAP